MSDVNKKEGSKVNVDDTINSSDVIVSKPNKESQLNKESKVNGSKIKNSEQPKDQESKSTTSEKKQLKTPDTNKSNNDLKASKDEKAKSNHKEVKEDGKVEKNDGGNQRKAPGKGESKMRNFLKDPRVLQDVENLFEDLKGSKSDDFVDSSTILFLLNMLEISKTEPEYYWYIYTQVKDMDRLSKVQFIELFMNPPEYKPNDIEDIRNLFQIFDVKDKGGFGKVDFIEFFKFSPIYQSNPELVEDNLEKCFTNIQKIFGNRKITPVEFFQIINQNKKSD